MNSTVSTIKEFFLIPIIFTIAALAASFGYGYVSGDHSIGTAVNYLTITAILGMMELSLSFDNAIVNATKLEDMSAIWQKRFLTWGMIIAVFGMRFLFPLIIVSIFGHVAPWSAVSMALFAPDQYAKTLESASPMISAFGGNFLLMVALNFFFDPSGEKDTHWIVPVERAMTAFGSKADTLGIVALILAIDVFVASHLGADHAGGFMISAVAGIITFGLVEIMSGFMETDEEETDGNKTVTAVRNGGLAAFLYLEVQDASFSFDGVIGAFALSHMLVVIALGLGIGAVFVRGLTLLLVKNKTLNTNIYLEHGAFWAILFMAMVMEFKPYGELPDVVVGLTSAGLLGLAYMSSKRHAKKEAAAEITA